MKQIFITGVSGDIGSSLFSYIQKNNLKTLLLLDEGSSHRFRERIAYIHEELCDIKDGNIFDLQKVMEIFNKSSTIVHLAAVLNKPNMSKEEMAETLTVNGFLLGIFSKLIADLYHAPLFFYMSSQMIYQVLGKPGVKEWIDIAKSSFLDFWEKLGWDYREDGFVQANFKEKVFRMAKTFLEEYGVPQNINFYALTKLLGEEFTGNIANSVIARLSNIYGPGYVNDRKVPRLIKAKLLGSLIETENDIRDYIYVDDINNAIYRILLNKNLQNQRIVDFVSGQKIETNSLVHMINRFLPCQYGVILISNTKEPPAKGYSLPPLKKTFSEETEDSKRDDAFTLKFSDFLDRHLTDFEVGIQETIKYFQSVIDYHPKMRINVPVESFINDKERLIEKRNA